MKRLFATLIAFVAMINIAFAAVNINLANKEQLESLPGVGPVKAQAIVDLSLAQA
jgi:competence protein ComEA